MSDGEWWETERSGAGGAWGRWIGEEWGVRIIPQHQHKMEYRRHNARKENRRKEVIRCNGNFLFSLPYNLFLRLCASLLPPLWQQLVDCCCMLLIPSSLNAIKRVSSRCLVARYSTSIMVCFNLYHLSALHTHPPKCFIIVFLHCNQELSIHTKIDHAPCIIHHYKTAFVHMIILIQQITFHQTRLSTWLVISLSLNHILNIK